MTTQIPALVRITIDLTQEDYDRWNQAARARYGNPQAGYALALSDWIIDACEAAVPGPLSDEDWGKIMAGKRLTAKRPTTPRPTKKAKPPSKARATRRAGR